MKTKKPRKMTLAERNEAYKKLGLPPIRRITKATIKAEWKAKAKSLSLEHRQLILDLLHKGGLTFGEIANQAQVDTDTVLGVIELNTDYMDLSMRKETL